MTTHELQQHLRNPARSGLRFFPFHVAHELSDLAAVLLYDLHHRINTRQKPLTKDGLRWTYDPHALFTAHHPYASESGIRKALLALEQAGLIRIEKTGKYNGHRYDKKWWYALTKKGEAHATKWRMRFHPAVAASPDATRDAGTLGIPKAVFLEHFRYQLHHAANDGYVTMEPAKLKVPYSAKTLARHLEGLVANDILERDPRDKHRYRVVDNWRENLRPLTVPCARLLPALPPGGVGLMTAPSGGGKTSFGTFAAVQHALAGRQVILVTLEEPLGNVLDRLYAQEYGLLYTNLRRQEHDTMQRLEAKQQTTSERIRTVGSNLKLVDLSGTYPSPADILAAINEQVAQGFPPDLVFIDQLEFSSSGAPEEEAPMEESSEETAEDEPAEEPMVDEPVEEETTDDEPAEEPTHRPVPLAVALSEAFRGQPFCTWVLHQVEGNPRPAFGISRVVGGEEVTRCFDVVLGLGRTRYGSVEMDIELRVFPLQGALDFGTVFAADFARMRFKPKSGA